ncbi:MAG: hypothetical protein UT39_C0002G0004 [Candidatus Woesebacteria bacterium GW2011_GWA1_39_21]|uniref:LOG family protein n=1 Tax=Candidatus Woesebacteria bacterium GW2011_GWA1_39_21 TaxID=1618550 RepID=A0A0G0N8Q0_9BACT|nr:MAG: hypothetical protein UT39_C0002G0004 [Candidatus Woesebacteria bacterium GW2011_GWA1_39_21]
MKKLIFSISVFGSHHPPGDEVKVLIRELVEAVVEVDKSRFVLLHGGGDGMMKELAIVAKQFQVKSVGVGTKEYHGNFSDIPKTGEEFYLADNIFERVSRMVLPSWLVISLPEGGGGTEFETLAAFYALRTLTFREKKGEVIPFLEERKLIAMGEVGNRLNEHISLYQLWKKPGIKSRITILHDNKNFKEIIKQTLYERLAQE